MLKNKISISGDLGSGKTVLARKISEKAGIPIISVGGIQRKLAQKYGMDTTTFNKYMETHPEIDIECDNMVSEYGRSDEPLILDSRLAWHFVPHSFKIHLLCNKVIAAERIFKDNVRVNEKYNNVDETYKSMVERRKSEVKRFKLQYGVDIDNLNNYDIVIDTSFITPDDVFKYAWEAIEQWQNGLPYKKIWLSPRNLFPTRDDEYNIENKVVVCRTNEKFFILEGHFSVSEALANNIALIPVSFFSGEVSLPEDLTAITREWEKNHNFKFL
ncbi:MAG: AAA family ATPase [Bacteroidales bacterium]|nr:AAA family ATPase [Bacteroidales bacterium]